MPTAPISSRNPCATPGCGHGPGYHWPVGESRPAAACWVEGCRCLAWTDPSPNPTE